MLSTVLSGASWTALGAAAICLVCSLFVVFFYPKYAQWYVDRNRVAPSRLRGYWHCVVWALGMLFIGLLFALAASKATPPSESSVDAAADAILNASPASPGSDSGQALSNQPTSPPSPTNVPSLARHTADLLDQLDVLVLTRPDLLNESLTYYRGFDDPIVVELDRWRALGMEYSGTPVLCKEALGLLQGLGMSIHGGRIPQKYIDQDKAKYSNLKRRCKAVVAGDVAEAERRE